MDEGSTAAPVSNERRIIMITFSYFYVGGGSGHGGSETERCEVFPHESRSTIN